VRRVLIQPAADVLGDAKRPDTARALVANILARYTADKPVFTQRSSGCSTGGSRRWNGRPAVQSRATVGAGTSIVRDRPWPFFPGPQPSKWAHPLPSASEFRFLRTKGT
jgi:hypothetical protein